MGLTWPDVDFSTIHNPYYHHYLFKVPHVKKEQT